MPQPANERCQICKFFVRIEGSERGTCHWLPPVLLHGIQTEDGTTLRQGDKFNTMFPVVPVGRWCGQYKKGTP